MLMRYENIVSLRHRAIIYHLVAKLSHWVNLYLLAIKFDTDTGMNQGMELHRLTTLGLEHVHFVIRLSTGCIQAYIFVLIFGLLNNHKFDANLTIIP